MMYNIVRSQCLNGAGMRQNKCGDLEYLTFPALEETGMVEHLFTTRTGGVSRGIYSSMNFSIARGDNAEDVRRNYERIASVLHCGTEDMVAAKQTHTTNIRFVTRQDCGKGVVRPADYDNVDGLITKEERIALVTFYADCVPLYFVDTVHRAIGLAHSGWKGTVREMGRVMVETMKERFGTKPQELLAAIGPSICQECYEVSEDVALQFRALQAEDERILAPGASQGKYQLNLWAANFLILRKAGILAENISVTDICTCHNPSYLFSHRASKGQRGNLGAFLMLKES